MIQRGVPTIQNERGQVIIMAPFAILFIMIATFFMLNIGAMANERIRMQVAADAAARDAAYIQAMALGSITYINDGMIIPGDLLWDAGALQLVKAGVEAAACASDPVFNFEDCIEAVEDFEGGEDKISKGKKLVKNGKSMQSAVVDAMNIAIPIAVFTEARNNGADGGAPIPSWDLKMKRKDTGFFQYVDMGDVWEFESAKVKVGILKWTKDGYASNFFDGFEFPYYTAVSAASPYCESGSTFECATEPWRTWKASLVTTL